MTCLFQDALAPVGAPTTDTLDANGNLTVANTGGALTTNTWSPQNQVLNLANPDGTSGQYLYSQDGLHKGATTGSGTTLFTMDGPSVLLETTTVGTLQARYTSCPDQYGGLVSQNRGGASSFYGFDSQQSSRVLVSTGGAITDSYSYKAFGEELQSGSASVNPYRYVGNQGY